MSAGPPNRGGSARPTASRYASTAGAKVSAKLPAGLQLDTVDPGKGSSLHAAPAAFVAETDIPADPSSSDSPSADPTATSEPTPTVTESDTAPASEAPTVTPSETATDSPSPTASDSSSPTASTSPSASLPPAPPSTVPKPPITSRAGWGADESISPEAPEYNDTVKAVFVHHTAGTNDYSCADSAAIVRGVYAYHVQSEGWKDIGYNFLVDKCGTIFEGRKGGVDRPVLGAHTYGFNRESTGISVLGTYTDAAAPGAVTASVARIAAWKLGQYKGDPAGSTMLTAGANGSNGFGKTFTAGTQYSFKQISGHRDGFNTECPGTKLYGQLPTIRSYAAGPRHRTHRQVDDRCHAVRDDVLHQVRDHGGLVGDHAERLHLQVRAAGRRQERRHHRGHRDLGEGHPRRAAPTRSRSAPRTSRGRRPRPRSRPWSPTRRRPRSPPSRTSRCAPAR